GTGHAASSPRGWRAGGDTSPAGVTSFGTWGNQQVTAKDDEDWFTADFSRYFNDGALSSIDFGLRYADHSREALSPEGATPGDIWSTLQDGATAPTRLASPTASAAISRATCGTSPRARSGRRSSATPPGWPATTAPPAATTTAPSGRWTRRTWPPTSRPTS